MRAMVRNLIIASMALTFFAIFGGNWMGAWFTIHSLEDVEGSTVSEGVTYFKLGERAFVVEITYDGETEKDTENIDYDDNDCGLAGDCDELDDLMMGKIRVLLFRDRNFDRFLRKDALLYVNNHINYLRLLLIRWLKIHLLMRHSEILSVLAVSQF